MTLNVGIGAMTRTEAHEALNWADDAGHMPADTFAILSAYTAGRRNAFDAIEKALATRATGHNDAMESYRGNAEQVGDFQTRAHEVAILQEAVSAIRGDE